MIGRGAGYLPVDLSVDILRGLSSAGGRWTGLMEVGSHGSRWVYSSG